jgi:hypothetical protein
MIPKTIIITVINILIKVWNCKGEDKKIIVEMKLLETIE